jgi:putative ABC transport system permease protein
MGQFARAWRNRRRPRQVDRDRQEDDLKDEIAFHLRAETEHRMAMGQSPDDARRAAARDFGNVTLVEDVTRTMWGWRVARERVLQDVRFAARTLARDPSFTVVAFVTLALGIAATVMVFAVTKAVLLDPLPFPDPDRLVMVWERAPGGEDRNVASAFNFTRWRTRNQSFESLGAIGQVPMNVSGLGQAEQVDGLAVTAELFDALGVQPLLGRTIRTGEDVVGGPLTVVLGYGFWQRRFGGDREAIGRFLTINGAAREIVGVMPASFAFPAARAAELYTGLPIDPTAPPGGRNLITVARLKPGVTLEAARSDMQRVVAQLIEEGTPNLPRGWSASVFPLFDETVGPVRRILWVILGSVACLLLLACANVANLLLIRAGKRMPELAVRAALGAGRWRLVHQLAAESLVLTIGAGAAGLALALLLVPAIPSLFPPSFPLPRATEIAVDRSVVAVTLGVSCGIGLLFSLLPVLRAVQGRLADSLRSGGRSALATHSRLRRGMVMLEVAIALVLVFGASLMGRSLVELSAVNPGFQLEQVLTLRMLMVPAKYGPPTQQVSFLKAVLDEIRAVPGVVSASSIHFLPLSGIASEAPVFRLDRPEPPREQLRGGPVSVITEGYFSTMGIPLSGRDFNSGDRLGTPTVVIVNESLAKQLFPDENAIGKHIRAGYSPATENMEIVGIAGDVRTGTIDRQPGPAIYIAHDQEPSLVASLVVRTQATPASAATAVRAAIARVDPDQGVSQVQPLETLIANASARPRVQAGVFGVFGVLALLIAGVGLYGVMAYGVEQRRRELGLRLALGAAPGGLLRKIVLEGIGLAAVGAVVGAILAWLTSGSLEGLLYETQPTDPAILLGVGVTLIAVACLATLAPAVRATRVDPLVVLREE